jgi:hypothetical protein
VTSWNTYFVILSPSYSRGKYFPTTGSARADEGGRVTVVGKVRSWQRRDPNAALASILRPVWSYCGSFTPPQLFLNAAIAASRVGS